MRGSGVPFAIVRPTALTEEDAGAELQFDQGDTIKVVSFRHAPLLFRPISQLQCLPQRRTRYLAGRGVRLTPFNNL